MASKQELEQLIDATDIVSLVSEYVKLERQGKNYMGLCPFHNENTPSFVVSQEKKIAHCFGCGGGGDPIKFLMQIENIDFYSAINKLSEKTGVKVSGYVKNINPNPLTKYYNLMKDSLNFYNKFLLETEYGKDAINYLHKRGLDDETIKMFKVGLSPNELNYLYQFLKELNYLELDMADLGLIDKNDKGYYDLFTKRIMFPICDEIGNVLGYSGRIYNSNDKNQPKYVNSRETVLFKKKDILFNLHLAKGEILKKKRVILHEGQMDVIASYRSGLKEAICTLGTALSPQQAAILKKYTNHAIICYDGDKAGINASLKAIKIFQNAGFTVHLVLLPGGSDPDDFVLKHGSKEYVEYFENNMIDSDTYIFEQALLNKNLSDETVVESVKIEIFEMIFSSNSKTKEELFIKRLSTSLNVSFDAVFNDYQSYCNTHSRKKNVENYPYYDDFIYDNAIAIKDSSLDFRYETRLFMYAKISREKALEIDDLLISHMDSLSEKSRNLWIALRNDYYEKYEEFNENLFLSILNNDNYEYYKKITESLKKDKAPYSDSDLYECIKKLDTSGFDRKNEILNKQIKKSTSDDEKNNLLSLKFENKNKKDKLQKNRRK